MSPSGACLEIDCGGGVDAFEVRVLPTDLASNCYRFTDVAHVESTTDVEFFVTDDGVDFLFESLLFRRVGGSSEDDPPDPERGA